MFNPRSSLITPFGPCVYDGDLYRDMLDRDTGLDCTFFPLSDQQTSSLAQGS